MRLNTGHVGLTSGFCTLVSPLQQKPTWIFLHLLVLNVSAVTPPHPPLMVLERVSALYWTEHGYSSKPQLSVIKFPLLYTLCFVFLILESVNLLLM